jgi:hypothetical protein
MQRHFDLNTKFAKVSKGEKKFIYIYYNFLCAEEL